MVSPSGSASGGGPGSYNNSNVNTIETSMNFFKTNNQKFSTGSGSQTRNLNQGEVLKNTDKVIMSSNHKIKIVENNDKLNNIMKKSQKISNPALNTSMSKSNPASTSKPPKDTNYNTIEVSGVPYSQMVIDSSQKSNNSAMKQDSSQASSNNSNPMNYTKYSTISATGNVNSIQKRIPQSTTNSNTIFISTPIFTNTQGTPSSIVNSQPSLLEASSVNKSNTKQNFFNNMIQKKTPSNQSRGARTINVNFCGASSQIKYSNLKDINVDSSNNSNQSGSLSKDPAINKYTKSSMNKIGKVNLIKNSSNVSSSFTSIYPKNSNSVSPSGVKTKFSNFNEKSQIDSSNSACNKPNPAEEEDSAKRKKNSIFKISIEKTLMNSHSQYNNNQMTSSQSNHPLFPSNNPKYHQILQGMNNSKEDLSDQSRNEKNAANKQIFSMFYSSENIEPMKNTQKRLVSPSKAKTIIISKTTNNKELDRLIEASPFLKRIHMLRLLKHWQAYTSRASFFRKRANLSKNLLLLQLPESVSSASNTSRSFVGIGSKAMLLSSDPKMSLLDDVVECFNNKITNMSYSFINKNNKDAVISSLQSLVNELNQIKTEAVDEVKREIQETGKMIDSIRSQIKSSIDYITKYSDYLNASLKKTTPKASSNLNTSTPNSQNMKRTQSLIASCQQITNHYCTIFNRLARLIHFLTISNFFNKTFELSIFFHKLLTQTVIFQVQYSLSVEEDKVSLNQQPSTNDFIKKIEEILQAFLNGLFVKNSCLSLFKDMIEKPAIFFAAKKKVSFLIYENLYKFYKANVISTLKNKTLRVLKNTLEFGNADGNPAYNSYFNQYLNQLKCSIQSINSITFGNQAITEIAIKYNELQNLQCSKQTIKDINLKDRENNGLSHSIIHQLKKLGINPESCLMVEKKFIFVYKKIEEDINDLIESKQSRFVKTVTLQLEPLLNEILSLSKGNEKINTSSEDVESVYYKLISVRRLIESNLAQVSLVLQYEGSIFENIIKQIIYKPTDKSVEAVGKMILQAKSTDFSALQRNINKDIKELESKVAGKLNKGGLEKSLKEINEELDQLETYIINSDKRTSASLAAIKNRIVLMLNQINFLEKSNLDVVSLLKMSPEKIEESLNSKNVNKLSFSTIMRFVEYELLSKSSQQNSLKIEDLYLATENMLVNYNTYVGSKLLVSSFQTLISRLREVKYILQASTGKVKGDLLQEKLLLDKSLINLRKLFYMVFLEGSDFGLLILEVECLSIENFELSLEEVSSILSSNSEEDYFSKYVVKVISNLLANSPKSLKRGNENSSPSESFKEGGNYKGEIKDLFSSFKANLRVSENALTNLNIYVATILSNNYLLQRIISKDTLLNFKILLDATIEVFSKISDFTYLYDEYLINKVLIEQLLSSGFTAKSDSREQLTMFNEEFSLSLIFVYISLIAKTFSGSTININYFADLKQLLDSVSKELSTLISLKNEYCKRIKEKYPKILFMNAGQNNSSSFIEFLEWNFDLVRRSRAGSSNSKPQTLGTTSGNITGSMNNTQNISGQAKFTFTKSDIVKLNYYYFLLNSNYLTITSKSGPATATASTTINQRASLTNLSNPTGSQQIGNVTHYFINGVHASRTKFISFQSKIDVSKLFSSGSDLLSLLNKIDSELKISLKCEIVNSLNSFPRSNFSDWVFSTSLQVSICNMNLIFSNEISQILLNTSNQEESESSDESDNKQNQNNTSILNRAEKLKSGVKKPKKLEEGAVIKNDLEALYMRYQAWTEAIIKKLNNLTSKDNRDVGTNPTLQAMIKSMGLVTVTYNDFSSVLKRSGSLTNSSIGASTSTTSIFGFNELVKQNIQNILIVLNNHRNILQQLISSNIVEVESYDWLKFIRHLWDDERKDVIVECGGWSIYQQYNFIPNTKIILTPQTEKIFLFAASCFREKSAAIVKTTFNAYSYYHIFEEFASNFWINLIKISMKIPQPTDSFESPSLIAINSVSAIQQIFDNSTINKSWIFFENFDQVSTENVKVISKLMQIIQQEIILNEIKITSANSSKFCKMFCLFGCLKVEANYKLKEGYLKSSCRIMNLTKPDLDFFVKNLIEISGFVSMDQASGQFKLGETIKQVYSILLTNTEKLIASQDPNFYFDFYALYSIQSYLSQKLLSYYLANAQVHASKLTLIRYLVDFLIDYLKNLGYYSDDELSNSLTLSIKQSINAGCYALPASPADIQQIKDEINHTFNAYSNSVADLNFLNFKQYYDVNHLILSEGVTKSFFAFVSNFSNNNVKVPAVYGNRVSGKSLFIHAAVNAMNNNPFLCSDAQLKTSQMKANHKLIYISKYMMSNPDFDLASIVEAGNHSVSSANLGSTSVLNSNVYVFDRVENITSSFFISQIKPLIFKYGVNTANHLNLNSSINCITSNKNNKFILELDYLKSFSHSDITFYQLINLSVPHSSNHHKKLIKSYMKRVSHFLKFLNLVIPDELFLSYLEFASKLILELVNSGEDFEDRAAMFIVEFFNLLDIFLSVLAHIESNSATSILSSKSLLLNILIQTYLLVNINRQKKLKPNLTIQQFNSSLITIVKDNSKAIFKQEYYSDFFNATSNEAIEVTDIFLDLKTFSFKSFEKAEVSERNNVNQPLLNYFLGLHKQYPKTPIYGFLNLHPTGISSTKCIVSGAESMLKSSMIKQYLKLKKHESFNFTRYAKTYDLNISKTTNVIYIQDCNIGSHSEFFNHIHDSRYEHTGDSLQIFVNLKKQISSIIGELTINSNRDPSSQAIYYQSNKFEVAYSNDEINHIYKKIMTISYNDWKSSVLRTNMLQENDSFVSSIKNLFSLYLNKVKPIKDMSDSESLKNITEFSYLFLVDPSDRCLLGFSGIETDLNEKLQDKNIYIKPLYSLAFSKQSFNYVESTSKSIKGGAYDTTSTTEKLNGKLQDFYESFLNKEYPDYGTTTTVNLARLLFNIMLREQYSRLVINIDHNLLKVFVETYLAANQNVKNLYLFDSIESYIDFCGETPSIKLRNGYMIIFDKFPKNELLNKISNAGHYIKLVIVSEYTLPATHDLDLRDFKFFDFINSFFSFSASIEQFLINAFNQKLNSLIGFFNMQNYENTQQFSKIIPEDVSKFVHNLVNLIKSITTKYSASNDFTKNTLISPWLLESRSKIDKGEMLLSSFVYYFIKTSTAVMASRYKFRVVNDLNDMRQLIMGNEPERKSCAIPKESNDKINNYIKTLANLDKGKFVNYVKKYFQDSSNINSKQLFSDSNCIFRFLDLIVSGSEQLGLSKLLSMTAALQYPSKSQLAYVDNILHLVIKGIQSLFNKSDFTIIWKQIETNKQSKQDLCNAYDKMIAKSKSDSSFQAENPVIYCLIMISYEIFCLIKENKYIQASTSQSKTFATSSFNEGHLKAIRNECSNYYSVSKSDSSMDLRISLAASVTITCLISSEYLINSYFYEDIKEVSEILDKINKILQKLTATFVEHKTNTTFKQEDELVDLMFVDEFLIENQLVINTFETCQSSMTQKLLLIRDHFQNKNKNSIRSKVNTHTVNKHSLLEQHITSKFRSVSDPSSSSAYLNMLLSLIITNKEDIEMYSKYTASTKQINVSNFANRTLNIDLIERFRKPESLSKPYLLPLLEPIRNLQEEYVNAEVNLLSSSTLDSRIYKEISQILTYSLKQYTHLLDYQELANTELFLMEDFKANYEDKQLQNMKPDFYINSILEKLFLGINNKFLLAILFTLQIMKENHEITEEEINFIIYLLKNNFRIKEDSSIKLKSKTPVELNNIGSAEIHMHDSTRNIYSYNSNKSTSFNNSQFACYNSNKTNNNANQGHVSMPSNNSNPSGQSFISQNAEDQIMSPFDKQKMQAKLLISMYKSEALSLDDDLLITQSFVELIESLLGGSISSHSSSISNMNTSNQALKKTPSQIPSILNNHIQGNSQFLNVFKRQLTKDSQKIIFSLIFLEEESLSFFKYLINKYLKPIHAIDQFKINNLLKKRLKTPISIKSDNSINVTNFLCSLAAYYEIEFFIVRESRFNPSGNTAKLLYDYSYIVDSNVHNFIYEGLVNGYWILLTTDLTFADFCKILNLIKTHESNIHQNFKLFFDINIISAINSKGAFTRKNVIDRSSEYKTMLENFTLMLQIDTGSVDDLEAAHDIWVNVLEENILNKTVMDETQKEILNLNNNFKHHEISAVSQMIKKKSLTNASGLSNKSELNELGEIHRHLNNIKFN